MIKLTCNPFQFKHEIHVLATTMFVTRKCLRLILWLCNVYEKNDDMSSQSCTWKPFLWSSAVIYEDDQIQFWRSLTLIPLQSVEKEDSMGMARLDHPAGKVFNFKKKSPGEESRIVTRVFKDTTAMTNCLQLRGSMLNHHMPWGYDGLFQNYGTDVSQVPNDVFQEVLALSDDN